MPNIQQSTSKVQETTSVKPLSVKVFNFASGHWEHAQFELRQTQVHDKWFPVYVKVGDPDCVVPARSFMRAIKEGWVRVLSSTSANILFGSHQASA